MRSAFLISLLTFSAVGCRTPAPPTLTVVVPPLPAPPPELPDARITPFEPDYKSLPLLTASTVTPGEHKPPRGIEEATVVALAGARSTTATLLERENDLPTCNAGTELLKELRGFVAAEARNRSVGEALGSFYQLADADGRADLLRQSMLRIGDLRAAAEKAKAEGARVPIEPNDLDQQKAQTLGILGQADLGANLLEIDLLRRLGLSGKAGERLRPTGKFDLDLPVQDADAAVQKALGTRADLQAVRLLYLRLNTENLPAIREYLRGSPAGSGLVGPAIPGTRWLLQRHLSKAEAKAAPALAGEVEVRRRQLLTLIEEKERITADEVRAALLALDEQYRQVGLARGRAENLIAKLADLKRQTKGPFLEVPAEVEVLRARAEVLAAVMGWHQARVKLLAAQGAYSAR